MVEPMPQRAAIAFDELRLLAPRRHIERDQTFGEIENEPAIVRRGWAN